MVRQIVAHWEAFDIRRSCPLTATALDHEERFEELVRSVSFGATSAFVESKSRSFLEQVARREHGIVGAIARFELALALVGRGDPGPHLIDWDRDPAVIDALVEGHWPAQDPRRGRYRTIVAADLPGLASVESLSDAAPVLNEL